MYYQDYDYINEANIVLMYLVAKRATCFSVTFISPEFKIYFSEVIFLLRTFNTFFNKLVLVNFGITRLKHSVITTTGFLLDTFHASNLLA